MSWKFFEVGLEKYLIASNTVSPGITVASTQIGSILTLKSSLQFMYSHSTSVCHLYYYWKAHRGGSEKGVDYYTRTVGTIVSGVFTDSTCWAHVRGGEADWTWRISRYLPDTHERHHPKNMMFGLVRSTTRWTLPETLFYWAFNSPVEYLQYIESGEGSKLLLTTWLTGNHRIFCKACS